MPLTPLILKQDLQPLCRMEVLWAMQHIHLLSMGRYKLIILHLQLTPVWWGREQLLLRLLFTNKNNIILTPEGEDSHIKLMGVIVGNFEKNP